MSKIKTKSGITMYYEQHGSGEDLILIGGLASDHTVWSMTLDSLAAKYRVLVFDNRGVGQTDAPAGPYTIQMMAEDTVALMDSLSIKNAGIVGHSMGCDILLQMCLSDPDRVRKAIHCASAAKLPFPSLMHIKSVVKYREMGMDPNLIFETAFPWIFGASFLRNRAKVAEAMNNLINSPYPQSLEAFKAQVAACEALDLEKEISNISTDTLILAGIEDLMMPLRFSEFIHQHIVGSKLETISDCGHMLPVEQSETLGNKILGFLET